MSGFVTLPITEVRRETSDALSVAFDVPISQRANFAFKPGQHVNVRAKIGEEEVRRTYSICSDPAEPGFRIAIKRIEGGLFSTWAHAELQAGMALDAEPPTGRFVLAPGDGAPRLILAIAAGIGITPVVGIVGQALQADDATRVILVYGNRSIEDAAFASELESLKDRYVARLTVLHVLSRSEDTDSPRLEGRIDQQKLRMLAGRLFDPQQVSQAYLCGPGSLIKDARATLFDLGVPRERLHYEFFAAGGGAFRAPADVALPRSRGEQRAGDGAIEVAVTLDGARHRFSLRPGEPVIEGALRAGLRVPYACKGGMCCTCRAKLIEGRAEMRLNYSLEQWEIDRGFILTCQAVATSERLVIDYDQM